MRDTLVRLALLGSFVVCGVGCPAVYPELEARVRPMPAAVPLEPPPPEEVRWIRFLSAKIPPKTRDGRDWDQVFGSQVDPYAILYVNDRELFRTPTASDTLDPDWSSGPRGNFEIGPDDRLRVELWHDHPINDQPIGVRDIGKPQADWTASGMVRVTFDSGGEVVLAWQPAHAVYGLGLWYELRTGACYVTRTLEHSPATRAGLAKGDRIVRIGGRQVEHMSTDEVRSAFGAIPTSGLDLLVRHRDGTTSEVRLVEGPIYALHRQRGDLD